MIPKRPAPDVIRGGNRFSEKVHAQARSASRPRAAADSDPSDARTAAVNRGTTMAQQDHDIDPFKVSSPRIFLVRMMLFLVLGALLIVILYKQIWAAFLANPGLNALIIGVLFIGIV